MSSLIQSITIFRPLSSRLQGVSAAFSELNQRGFITVSGGMLFFLLIAGYVGMLYVSFTQGFKIRQQTAALRELKEEVREGEVFVQQKRARFIVDHQELFDSMEKITAVKYLSAPSVVVSRPGTGN